MNTNNSVSKSNILDFEPSQNTKTLWLSTRKAGKQVTGNLRLPGLFETVKYPQDKALFGLAMTLEIVGLLIISALADWGLLIAGTVAALVAIDVFLAIGLHFQQGKICKYSNMAITAIDNDTRIANKNRLKKAEKWWLGKVCIVFLWVFAGIKASAFYVLNPETYIYGILMLLIYAFIAYVHIRHTGYFLAEWRRLSAYNKEKDIFLEEKIKPHEQKSDAARNTTVSEYRSFTLNTKLPLQEIHYKKGEDENGIRENGIKTEDTVWKLITWGLMDDEDLHNLTASTDGEVREYIAKQCLTAQLFMLDKNASEK